MYEENAEGLSLEFRTDNVTSRKQCQCIAIFVNYEGVLIKS